MKIGGKHLYPQGTIIKTIKSEYSNVVNYCGEKNIEVLEKGEYFTECKVTETGEKGLIKNEYIEGKENIFKYWYPMFSFISVYENEIVSVIDNSCKGYTYIRNSKYKLGWVPKESINMVDT